jgi:hypothetical protein
MRSTVSGWAVWRGHARGAKNARARLLVSCGRNFLLHRRFGHFEFADEPIIIATIRP